LKLLQTVLILASALPAMAGVTVTSPASGSTNPSSVHFKASATASHAIVAMKIYIDSSSKYSTSHSYLDTYLTLASGTRHVTIKAWDSTGATVSKSFTISISGSSSSSDTTGSTTTTSSSAKSFSNIEEMSGWDGCTSCAGGGADAQYSLTKVTSPSLDGLAGKVFVGGTTPFSHSLWWKNLSSTDSSKSHFVLDMYYYIKEPQKSFGLEFAVNQAYGGKRWKWSTQCSFNKGIWSAWDSKNRKWVGTSVPCKRPPAYSWQHVVLEYSRSSGKALFVAFTLNGHKYYVNKSFYPESYSSNGMNTHFQINGNASQDDYYVWFDRMKVTYW
jgi:hypothetical protein